MIDAIFDDLMQQPGIHAAMVIGGNGQLLAFKGDVIYDRALLRDVAGMISKALDSVELLHANWDSIQARFGDGSLMIRNLGAIPHQVGRSVVAVVADPSLNRSFATVAMRVLVQKLKQALATGPGALQQALRRPAPPPPPPLRTAPAQSQGMAAPGSHSGIGRNQPSMGLGAAQSSLYGSSASGAYSMGQEDSGLASSPDIGPSQSEVSSGLSWSGAGASNSSGLGVTVVDQVSMDTLSQLAKAYAPFVGPMAKVFVKDAVRSICREAPFSSTQALDIVRTLASQIEDLKDRERFLNSTRPFTAGV